MEQANQLRIDYGLPIGLRLTEASNSCASDLARSAGELTTSHYAKLEPVPSRLSDEVRNDIFGQSAETDCLSMNPHQPRLFEL